MNKEYRSMEIYHVINEYSGNSIDIIAIIAAIIAFISLWFFIFFTIRNNKKALYKELLDEYRSEKMGATIAQLWKYFDRIKTSCIQQHNEENGDEINKSIPIGKIDGDLKKKIMDKYMQVYYFQYLSDNKKNFYEGCFHIKRRHVSQYFQLVSLYNTKRYIKLDILKTFWGSGTMSTIKYILYPAEVVMNKIFTYENEGLTEKIENMQILYDKFNPDDPIDTDLLKSFNIENDCNLLKDKKKELKSFVIKPSSN